MGSKSKPTIGYWYSMLIHFGLGRGPLDALLEFRGGDKTAWAGEQTTNGVIEVNAENLWGGEKAEGGIKGQLHVMMGAQDQMPSALLADVLGPDQSAYRGRATVIYNGRYGAFNPYPKPAAFKVRRILKGWDGDVCWYEEKAAIGMGGEGLLSAESFAETFSAGLDPYDATQGGPSLAGFTVVSAMGGPALQIDGAAAGAARTIRRFGPTGEWVGFSAEVTLEEATSDDNAVMYFWGPSSSDSQVIKGILNFSRQSIYAPGGIRRATFWVQGAAIDSGTGIALTDGTLDLGVVYKFEGDYLPAEDRWSVRVYRAGVLINTLSIPVSVAPGRVNEIRFQTEIAAGLARIRLPGYRYIPTDPPFYGMNPAHILYDSLTSQDMQGEPVDLINEASFTVAADRLFAEGFGLCTEYDAGSETVEQFQQRICNVIGATLSQSRTNGQYYLMLVRGDYDVGSLPILGDDDILEYAEETTDPLESVNQVGIEWFDPIKKEKRTTTPLQALGAIQAAGGVMAETIAYPEIPSESLALRVGARDLRQKSLPLKRFTLTTTRKPYNWRAGRIFRLQAPRRGIADMVCVLGEIGAGVRRSGAMSVRALQDVSGLPSTTYVVAEPGVDTSPSPVPTVPDIQAAFEASFIDLVGRLTAGERAALSDDAGFLLTAAARPGNGVNYDLWTRASGEEFADGGSGDWSPAAIVVEGASQTDTDFTVTQANGLEAVAVGEAALWGQEVCRVEAINPGDGTLTLARGCADTVPQIHPAGQPILFYEGDASSDTREYSDGEIVEAKVRTRTASQLLELELAPTLTLEMAGRFARPYPPGLLRLSDGIGADRAYPTTVRGEITVTWAHRDRLLQADQVISESEASIGPEAGTTYTVTYYLDEDIEHTESGITGTSATPQLLSGIGVGRIEVVAIRDGLVSWQAATAEFTYDPAPLSRRITDSGDYRIIDSGEGRLLE